MRSGHYKRDARRITGAERGARGEVVMKQLSGLDASFLYLETPEMPMHVGALHLFELPAGYKGKFVRDLRRHVAKRLPMMPALRRRLWWMPLKLANPAWVDAEADLDEHIVEIRLPKGSQLKELEQMVGKLHAVLLDRSKPLWKFHVFEGLAPSEDGRKRVAMYTQLHHAAVDGQAAVALASVLLDVTEKPREIDVKPSARPKRYRLGLAEMLSGAVANQVQQLSQLLRTLPTTVGTLSKAAKQAAARSQLVTGKKGVSNFALAPRTPLNVTVSDGRAFAAVGVPLNELRAMIEPRRGISIAPRTLPSMSSPPTCNGAGFSVVVANSNAASFDGCVVPSRSPSTWPISGCSSAPKVAKANGTVKPSRWWASRRPRNIPAA